MAGPKSNVIEYFFEGNALGLEASIKKVSSLLLSSVRSFNKYQEGGINKVQRAQVDSLRASLKYLKELSEKGGELTKEEVRQANKLIKETLTGAKRIHTASLRAQDKFIAATEKRNRQIEANSSLSAQASAEQHSKYLEGSVKAYQGIVDQKYLTDIQQSVDLYKGVVEGFNEGKFSAEELAGAIKQLQETYYAYNETLRNVRYEQSMTNKGIVDFASFMAKAKEVLQMTLRSFQFWQRMLRKTIQLIKEGIKYVADYVESINFLEVALKGTNKEFHQFLKIQEHALGIDPTALNTIAASFLSFGNSMGFANEQAVNFSMNMTQLAQDLASLYNTDVESMMKKIRSGISGQTRALQAYGISVHDATVEEWLLSKGINANMRDLSASARAYARYIYLLETTQDAHGDLARTLSSPANQLKILRTQLKLLVQNFGSVATTLVMPLIRLFNLLVQPLNAFLKAVFEISNAGFSTAIAEDTEALEDEYEAAENLKGSLTGLDEINQEADAGVKNDSGVPDWLSELGGNFAYDNLTEGIGSLVSVFEKLGQAIAPIFNLLNAPFDLFINTINVLADAFAGILTPLEPILKGFSWLITSIMNPLIDFIGALTDNIWMLVGAFAVLNLAQLAYTGSLTSMMAVKAILWMKSLATAIWSNVSAAIANVAATIKMKAASAAMAIANWWETISWWQKAVAVIAAAGALALVVAGVVVAATSRVKSISSRSTENKPPALAKGGVVTGPTLALVGEGRHDEAVVPLGNSPQFTSMKESIAQEVVLGLSGAMSLQGASGGSSSQPVILQMDGRELARALWPALASTKNQVGVKLT